MTNRQMGFLFVFSMLAITVGGLSGGYVYSQKTNGQGIEGTIEDALEKEKNLRVRGAEKQIVKSIETQPLESLSAEAAVAAARAAAVQARQAARQAQKAAEEAKAALEEVKTSDVTEAVKAEEKARKAAAEAQAASEEAELAAQKAKAAQGQALKKAREEEEKVIDRAKERNLPSY